MIMDYKISTVYTREALIDFKKFTLTKDSFLKPIVLYIMCVVVVACSFIYTGRFELTFTTVVYPLISIIGALLVTYIYYIAPSKTDDPMEDLEVEYTFTEDAIISGDDSFEYSKLFGIYEDTSYYYIYTTESNGILLEKDEVEPGLKALLIKKIPTKKQHFKKAKNKPKAAKPAHA